MTESNSDFEPTPVSALQRDSLIVDLFSLNAALRVRGGGAELTSLGQSRMQELEGVTVGDELLFHTTKNVRTLIFAYFQHVQDLQCEDNYQGDQALLIIFDDSIPGKCHETAFSWAQGYPYWKPFFPAYVEGKGFWISPGEVHFATGKLKIFFDYQPTPL